MLTIMPIIQLSICPCGEPVLNDDVEIGACYGVDLTTEKRGYYRCGRCGCEQDSVPIVKASSRADFSASIGWLPLGLFQIEASGAANTVMMEGE